MKANIRFFEPIYVTIALFIPQFIMICLLRDNVLFNYGSFFCKTLILFISIETK